MSYYAGQRIKVLKDNGRDGIVGFEGEVVQNSPSGVVVTLVNDPAEQFRMYIMGGFPRHRPGVRILRFFQIDEIEPFEGI